MIHLMFQALRDARLLLRLNRMQRLEIDGNPKRALQMGEETSYEGAYAGLLGAYLVRLMIISRDGRALEYVNTVRRFIRDNEDDLKFSSYCLTYCKYLRRVLAGFPYNGAACEVLEQPSTEFVRNILRVTFDADMQWRSASAKWTGGL